MPTHDHTTSNPGETKTRRTDKPAEPGLVAIIILNWNSKGNTLECLESLEAVRYPKKCLGLFVVDNGSDDDSVAVLGAKLESMGDQGWRDLVLVENRENLGFARGNNSGYEHVPDEYEYIYLSNDDIVFFEDCLDRIMGAFRGYPEAGIVGAKVLTYDAPHVLSHGAGYVRPLLLGTRSENADGPVFCDFVTGCALCIRRDVLGVLKTLFDPVFFAYWEDADLCARVRKAGFGVLYCPEARVLHKVSAATGGVQGPASPFRIRHIMHGKTVYARRHLAPVTRVLFYLLFAARFPWFVFRTLLREGRRAPALWREYIRGIRVAMAGDPGPQEKQARTTGERQF